MAGQEAVRYRIGLILIIALGSGLGVLHLAHLCTSGESLWTVVYGIVLPLAFSLGLVLCGLWLGSTDFNGPDVFRVGLWCWLGGAVLASGSIRTILYQQAEGVYMSDTAFLIAGQASLGGIIGFVVGVYSVRQHRVRVRAERLSGHLTVLNRVLRHDLRNEATVIQGRAEVLARETEDDDHLRTIQRHAETLEELSKQAQLVDRLARDADETLVEVDLAAIIEGHVARLEQQHPAVAFDVSLAAAERVEAHSLIDSAIGNVLENAIEHNDAAEPRITIESVVTRQSGARYVEVHLADNGPGIPDDAIAVLERGYETPLEHMHGLGLWIVHWIVRASDGEVRFAENTPRGSIVTIRLKPVR